MNLQHNHNHHKSNESPCGKTAGYQSSPFLYPRSKLRDIVKENKGVALLTVVTLLFAVMILILTGAQLITTSFKESKHQQNVVAEAENVARAGLTDAISWFKRQKVQPVRSSYSASPHTWEDGAFNPRTSTETINQNIGLVKEYELSENGIRWARYEVKRQTDTVYGFPYDPDAVHDITVERFRGGERKGEGLAWSIVSIGYIYRRKNSSIPFNTFPNEVVAKSKVSTEIMRIRLELPSPSCAFIVKDGGTASIPPALPTETVKLYRRARINGGVGAYGCGRVSGATAWIFDVNTSTVNGGLGKYTVVGNDPTINYVFGVSTTELKSLSDYAVNSVSSLPNPLPDMSLIYINGNATFDSARPLGGSGVLIVNGNLTVNTNSNSLYSGIIYVSGTATIMPPCYISGCVIAYNGLTLSYSTANEVAEIIYDQSIINSIRQQICQYRENKAAHRVFTGVPGF